MRADVLGLVEPPLIVGFGLQRYLVRMRAMAQHGGNRQQHRHNRRGQSNPFFPGMVRMFRVFLQFVCVQIASVILMAN
jgi:hypothetical protein